MSSASPSGANYIEHRVSKRDTLAGVAIKYGVEVVDIKRMNGLVTDSQMFALKSLQIPLPGRHLPSPSFSDSTASPRETSSEQSQLRKLHIDLLDSLQSLKSISPQLVSPAMNALQGYYGLKSVGTETVVQNGRHFSLEGEPQTTTSPSSGLPKRQHRRSRSLVNSFQTQNGDLVEALLPDGAAYSETDKSNEESFRSSWKAGSDPRTPELLLKDDCSNGFLGITGKGLAQRPKSANRLAPAAGTDSGWLHPFPVGDFSISSMFSGFRKSSSMSNLQASENSSSLGPTSKWKLRSDSQALSTAAIKKPIFDVLPKPAAVRRNKAALD